MVLGIDIWQDLGGSCMSYPVSVGLTTSSTMVMCVFTDEKIYQKEYVGSWGDWIELGTSKTAIAASKWGTTRVDIFAVGADKLLWHSMFDTAFWFDWESLGVEVYFAPTAVSWGTDRIDIVVEHYGTLLHKYYDGTCWYPWEKFTDLPVAV